MGIVRVIVILFRAYLLSRAVLAAEKLALRQQLGGLLRSARRSELPRRERVFWKPSLAARWHRSTPTVRQLSE